MEDADIHCCDIGDGNAIFGVFDGHGGIFLLRPRSLSQQIRLINLYLNPQGYGCIYKKEL